MPEGQVVAAPLPAVGQLPDAIPHVHRHPDRALRCVVDRQRVVEEDHQPVPGEPLQRSAVGEDQRPQRLVVLAEDAHHLLGLARLRERCEAAKIAEDHHDLASMAAQEVLVPGVHHQIDELWGEEPPQPVDPLQVLHLGGDPLLQLGVPLPQLGGLPVDRVVVALHPGQRGDPGQQLTAG